MVINTKPSLILDNVHLIPDEMFPLYLIKGKRNFLIDCAILSRSKIIDNAIQELLKPHPLHDVLLTHSHYDHTGALSLLQKKYPFRILCSNRTKEILSNPDAIVFIDEMNQKFKKILNDSSPTHFTRPEQISTVKEGDRIELENGQYLEVLETPGHTRCSLSFFLMPQKVLFCGDAAGIIEKNGGIKPLFLSSYNQYELSLRKLSTLNAIILALPHNRFIKGQEKISAFLSDSLQETHHAREIILELLSDDLPTETIAERIIESEYPESTLMGPREAMLINVNAMVRSIKKEIYDPSRGL